MRASPVPIGALALALMLLAPACGTPASTSAGSAPTPSTEPAKPAVEATLFAAQKPILADLPVTKLLPKDVPAVLAVRDPATIVAKLATLSPWTDAKDPLAKAIDDAAKDLTKDLPELAALAQSGVDLTKPAGLAWMNAELDTIAIFAAVSDEAAMKRWIDERAKQSKNRRELTTTDDAVVLRAKRDVTRAIVLCKGHVFWIRSKDRWGLDPDRVVRAAEALSKVAEPESLAADPTFAKTLGSLAYGAQAALYANVARLAESLVAARAKAVEGAKKARDDTAATLAEAEKKKRKTAIESARYDAGQAASALRSAENAAAKTAVLAELKADVPAFAAGVDLGDREVRLKAFVAMPKPSAVKLFAPLAGPSPVFDPSFPARAAAHVSIDPRLLAFLSEHLDLRRFERAVLPIDRARSALTALGVDAKSLDPLLDPELAAAGRASAPSAANPEVSGATHPATIEGDEGFTVVLRVADPAKATALLEEGWRSIEASDAVKNGSRKRTAPGAYEIASSGRSPAVHVRLTGSALLVTTQPKLAEAAAPPPEGSWLAASDHPVLKQIASIDGTSGVLAFDAGTYRAPSKPDLFSRLQDIGVLGSLLGPATKKSKKLEEQRDKLRDEQRKLEGARDAHAEATWRSFTERAGTTALVAKPIEGGVALYGGLFTTEPSLTALAESALTAWLTAGPRWEKAAELEALQKKIRDLDASIEAERTKGFEDLLSGALRDDPTSVLGGPRGVSRFDDDVGTLLSDPHFGAPDPPRTGSAGRGSTGSGALVAPPRKSP